MKGEKRFNFLFSGIAIFIVFLYIFIFFSSFSIVNLTVIKETIGKPDVRFGILLSLFTATLVTFISLLLGIPSSYALSRLQIPFKNIFDLILDIPVALSPVAVGAMFLMFFNTPQGIWIEKNLLKFVFEIPGIILVQTAIVLPFSIRIMKSHFDTIPESYELVARSLGYSKLKSFLYVTLPLSKNALLATVLTSFAKALGEFGATVTIAGAISMKTQTLPISIFMALSTADLEKTFVLIFILVLLSAINMIFIRLVIKRGPAI